MDKDLRNLLLVAGVITALLYLARPKKSSEKNGKNLLMPEETNTDSLDYENAKISIAAMRDAANDGVKNSELDDLNAEIQNEYNIKIFVENNKFYAKNSSGKVIAKEA